ncbi:MAG: TetR/AcrR family transcriptional regulator [Acidimicrobiales bacterium]
MTRYNGNMDNRADSLVPNSNDEVADESLTSTLRPSLREDSRDRARARIIQGALRAVAASGLDATIDEIAEAAGVSRRTVFRHFASHGELIAASISQGLSVLGTHMPATPQPGTDVQVWLTGAVVTVHQVIRQLLGRAFWDIHIDRPGTPQEVIAAIDDIAIQRRRFSGSLARSAWEALEGRGEPPRFVVDAFAQQVSGFATYALPQCSAQETGELSARILWLVLQQALEESGRKTLSRSNKVAPRL